MHPRDQPMGVFLKTLSCHMSDVLGMKVKWHSVDIHIAVTVVRMMEQELFAVEVSSQDKIQVSFFMGRVGHRG